MSSAPDIRRADVSVPITRVVLVAATAALGGFLFGFDTAVINGAVSAIGEQFDTGPFLLGFAVASALIGCAIGAWFAGRIADRYGRIRVMLIAAVAVHRQRDRLRVRVQRLGPVVLARRGRPRRGRGIRDRPRLHRRGLAAGLSRPPRLTSAARDRLGHLRRAAQRRGDRRGSRHRDGAVAAGAGGLAVDVPGRGRARAGLRRHGADHPRVAAVPHRARRDVARPRRCSRRYVGGNVEKVSTDILKTVEGKSDRPRFAILRRGKFGLLPIVWIGIGLSVLQQFTGINVIFYYSTTLWQAVGFTEQDSLTITVITSVTNILTTIVAIMLIDKVGRKPLLLVGAIGQFVCLAVLTLMFATATVVDGEPVLEGSAGTIALVAANLYVVFFGATWGPVVWVLLGEMFSNKIRAVALSVAASAQWAANFVISTTFPALAAVGLGLAYGVYTFFAFVAIFFVIKFVKETKGRTLESMSEEATPVA